MSRRAATFHEIGNTAWLTSFLSALLGASRARGWRAWSSRGGRSRTTGGRLARLVGPIACRAAERAAAVPLDLPVPAVQVAPQMVQPARAGHD